MSKLTAAWRVSYLKSGIKLAFESKREKTPVRWPLFTLLLSSIIVSLSLDVTRAAEKKLPIEVIAFHAHRYQNFQQNKSACEVSGEIRNIGKKAIRDITVNLKMLDKKGKIVASEDLTIPLRVIVGRNARGQLRAAKAQEIGIFTQDTRNCPEKWMEGRIKYKITAVSTE